MARILNPFSELIPNVSLDRQKLGIVKCSNSEDVRRSIIKIVLLIGLSVISQVGYSGSIGDNFATGDTLIATHLNNAKARSWGYSKGMSYSGGWRVWLKNGYERN